LKVPSKYLISKFFNEINSFSGFLINQQISEVTFFRFQVLLHFVSVHILYGAWSRRRQSNWICLRPKHHGMITIVVAMRLLLLAFIFFFSRLLLWFWSFILRSPFRSKVSQRNTHLNHISNGMHPIHDIRLHLTVLVRTFPFYTTHSYRSLHTIINFVQVTLSFIILCGSISSTTDQTSLTIRMMIIVALLYLIFAYFFTCAL